LYCWPAGFVERLFVYRCAYDSLTPFLMLSLGKKDFFLYLFSNLKFSESDARIGSQACLYLWGNKKTVWRSGPYGLIQAV
jgi:hypothetical protein